MCKPKYMTCQNGKKNYRLVNSRGSVNIYIYRYKHTFLFYRYNSIVCPIFAFYGFSQSLSLPLCISFPLPPSLCFSRARGENLNRSF